jgi:DNA-binding XRE family transcriptional regulator
MPVYFIRAGRKGPVKIGVADSIAVRLAQLQTAHWRELSVIREIEGGAREEQWLHSHFRSRHIRGEWFHFDASMLTVCPDATPPSPLSVWLSETGRTTDGLAAEVGVSGQSVRNWARGLGSPRVQHALKIQELSRGKIPVSYWVSAA